MRLAFKEIADVLGLTAPVVDGFIDGAAVDSRVVAPGDLFVCVPGAKVDGHAFAADAVARGAVAVLASRDIPDPGVPVFTAPDVVRSLAKLAARARARSGAKVICLTGTAGKTTLKDALKSIFQVSHKVLATNKNHNNQIGMPLTIFQGDGDEDYWILEAGISREGDMDELGEIARPDLAVVLNAGAGHCEGLGKRGVAANKARLLAWLTADGKAVVNAAYPDLAREARAIRPDAEFFDARDSVDCANALSGRYGLRLGERRLDVETPFMGDWGAELALCAARVAELCGVADEDIQLGLARAARPEHRFNLARVGKWRLIDDSYNANPLSMRKMLESAAECAKNDGSPLYLVLGEMGELGAEADARHRELGRVIAGLKPEAVFWKGDRGDLARGELNGIPFVELTEAADMPAALAPYVDRPGLILFKGSRANRLEECLAAATDFLREI